MPRHAITTFPAFLKEHTAIVEKLPPPQKIWFNVEEGGERVGTAVVDGDYAKCLHNCVEGCAPASLGVEHTMDCSGRCIGVRGNVVKKLVFSPEQFSLDTSKSTGLLGRGGSMMEEMFEFALFLPYDSTHVPHLECDLKFQELLEKTVRDMLPLFVHYMHPNEFEDLDTEQDLVDNITERFKIQISWRQPDVFPAVAGKSWTVDIGISAWFSEFTEFEYVAPAPADDEDEEDDEDCEEEPFLTEHDVHLPLLPEMQAFLKANLKTITNAMLDTALCGVPWRGWTPTNRGDASMKTFHFYKTKIDELAA
jgi:hypothetical protein